MTGQNQDDSVAGQNDGNTKNTNESGGMSGFSGMLNHFTFGLFNKSSTAEKESKAASGRDLMPVSEIHPNEEIANQPHVKAGKQMPD